MYYKEKDRLKSTFKSETDKVWNVIVDKFYSYYKTLGFTGKKTEVADAIFIGEIGKHEDTDKIFYSIDCDVKPEFKKNFNNDRHIYTSIILNSDFKYLCTANINRKSFEDSF